MSKIKLHFEDLPNEIIVDMFDYLNGQQIFSSFFNLNHRLKLLCIYYPNFYIDTKDLTLTNKTLERLVHSIPFEHISSLKLYARKGISRIPVEYFTCLHSLTVNNADNPTYITKFLEKLPSPDHLHHLSLNLNWCHADIKQLITTIFKLSNLNRLELYLDFKKLDFGTIKQPLLSLRHLSISCYLGNDYFKLVPFMPNLISLNLSYVYYENEFYFIFIQPNSLSKLRRLQMNKVRDYYVIDDIFQLCPQVKVFKVNCISGSHEPSMINAKDWEKVLSPMKFLKKIEINVDELDFRVQIDLTQYQTDFWIQRKLKAMTYYDQNLNSTIFYIK